LLRRRFSSLRPAAAAEKAGYLAAAVLIGRTRHGYPLGEILGRVARKQKLTEALHRKPGPTITLVDQLLAALPENEAELAGLFADDPVGATTNPVPSPPPWLNEFEFEPGATSVTPPGCPFHAHMRKMNPRNSTDDEQQSRKTSVIRAQPVRRGYTYDPAGALAEKERGESATWPATGAGLFFIGYMSNLERQFKTPHATWPRDTDFPEPRSGPDPLLFHPAPNPEFPKSSLLFGDVKLPKMPRILRRLGGAYLYCPSLPWLRRGGAPSP